MEDKEGGEEDEAGQTKKKKKKKKKKKTDTDNSDKPFTGSKGKSCLSYTLYTCFVFQIFCYYTMEITVNQ